MSSVCTSDSMKDLERKAELVAKCELALAQLAEAGVDVSEICCGCRCGWLCCDCALGCISCKELHNTCYCKWNVYTQRQNEIRNRIRPGSRHYDMCMFCRLLIPQCQCHIWPRCKWCVVSLEKCKRGGCIRKLPDRLSPVAQLYVDVFNVEDGPDDDDLPAGAQYMPGVKEDDADEDAGKKEGHGKECGALTPTDMPGATAAKDIPGLASPSTSSVMSAEYYSGSDSTASSDLETSSISSQEGEDPSCSR